MAGKTYLSPGVTEVLVKDYISQDSNPIRSSFSELTPREREVLQMIAGGKRTNQIADLLGISVKTVDSHRQKIMFKLRTRNIAELTKYAIREGLTTLDD
jgi:DNA-binding NarL/FixJ family response regulator